MSCIGCGERESEVQTIPKPTLVYPINGDGLSKEHPIYTTIEIRRLKN